MYVNMSAYMELESDSAWIAVGPDWVSNVHVCVCHHELCQHTAAGTVEL